MDRPVTSKPRGICRFYNTSRGCYAGDNCKFLHGAEETHTPFDKAKLCKYYQQGHCKRGDQCWFRHELPIRRGEGPTEASGDETCNICLETPATYGLLTDCSHVFCHQCIRQWRDPSSKSSDVIVSGVIKKCPLCRSASRFITPSSHFYREGDPRKKETIDKYRESMARVPCKYFQETMALGKPCCPFGMDCFYKHTNSDGTPHIFRHGAKHFMRIYRRRRQGGFAQSSSQMDAQEQFLRLFRAPINNLHATLDIIRANLPAFLERYEEAMNGTTVTDRDFRGDVEAYTEPAAPAGDAGDIDLEHLELVVSVVLSRFKTPLGMKQDVCLKA
ncbi:hypothetical protein BV22DRAFT_154422 [Leucogyrophana mollusca]|uniref:Uncharacterized protein n=1 Tax=Leucogyrophana mollusca TaxID=85980 RepID=A0ACB8BUE8_9AGAM|nr:hypothetical protein BV22DRAFT_154422 [Leucogyrophana mollusca]